uniref:Uncharacterized protein n=1 Tax=Panagrolaimus davidi TaxID=227884 RepID=A0A914P8M5_9BILA
MDAAELERVFAKQFVACFDGHNEGVGVLSNHPLRLSHFLFGARDGISVDAFVGEIFTTIGKDSQLKHWTDLIIIAEGISVWKLYRDSPV